MISITTLNETIEKQQILKFENLLNPLGISDISIDKDDFIVTYEDYKIEYGFFFKKTLEKTRAIFSYKVCFTFQNELFGIYIEENKCDREIYDLFKSQIRFLGDNHEQ